MSLSTNWLSFSSNGVLNVDEAPIAPITLEVDQPSIELVLEDASIHMTIVLVPA